MPDFVKISDSINSTNSNIAASSKAVKELYSRVNKVVEIPTIISSTDSLIVKFPVSIEVSSKSYLKNSSISKFVASFEISGTKYEFVSTSITNSKGVIDITVPEYASNFDTIKVSIIAYDNNNNASVPAFKTYSIVNALVNTPSISLPTANAIVHPGSISFTSTNFASTGATDTLVASRYKICSDSSGNNIVYDSGRIESTSTTYTATLTTKLAPGNTYYVFCQHEGAKLGVSSWSAGVKIVASKVNNPAITSPISGSEVMASSGLTIITSAFSCTGNVTDTHSSTDWKVTSDSEGNTIVAQDLGSSDKTSHTFTNLSVTAGNTYYAWVRYNSANCGSSEWIHVSFIASLGTVSLGGRTLYRHSSGMGTVIEYNDTLGDKKVLVVDAKYRGTGSMGDCLNPMDGTGVSTNYSLPDYQSSNTNDNWYIHGTDSATTPAEQAALSDETINTLWANTIDVNTSKHNCDVVLAETTTTPATAIEHARSIVVDGTPCDVPNIQILQRIYCEAELLDSMDPTVAEYPDYALGSANPNGAWYVGGNSAVWASTDGGIYGDYSCSWYVDSDGYCDYDGYRFYVLGVVPVLEL